MPPEANIAVAIARLEGMTAEMVEIKTALRDMAQAVSRLAVIEERQIATNEAIGRAFRDIGKLDTRMASIEQSAPLQKQSSDWVQAGAKYILALVLGAVVAGFIRVPSTVPVQPAAVVSGK